MEIQYQEAAKILGPTVVKDGQQKVGNCWLVEWKTCSSD
jgi:hypothetical protein